MNEPLRIGLLLFLLRRVGPDQKKLQGLSDLVASNGPVELV